MSQRVVSNNKTDLKIKGKNTSGSKMDKKEKSDAESNNTKNNKKKIGAYSNLNVFILRLLKDMHPDTGITKNGMKVMNSFNMNMLDTLATEAATLMKYQKAMTLNSNHILGAIKLVLPPELARNAGEECKKVLDTYLESVTNGQKP